MADWEIWVTIAALTVATAATRSSFWLAGHHITIPRRVQEILRYAPACALAAIIAPDLLVDPGQPLVPTLANPKLLAAIAATGYVLLRKSMLETIVFGMLAFTILRIWLH
jgi:branched-subunit amino acid transport protein